MAADLVVSERPINRIFRKLEARSDKLTRTLPSSYSTHFTTNLLIAQDFYHK